MFLSPAPWTILLTSVLSNPVWFYQAFVPAAFPVCQCLV
jgi:hypothetical protein